jgi:hypothetical protein
VEFNYPWADAPEWAMWGTTNDCGLQFWWQREPFPRERIFFEQLGKYALFGDIGKYCENWRESKQARPKQ